MKDFTKEYLRWCESDLFDEETKAELRALNDEEEIKDRFYRSLTFGTGGLRGVIGAGTNRMNFYTVGKATQGLADFLRSHSRGEGVVIAYDSRKMSPEFALDSACILAANGIKVYLFESLRPTPELSFAVRELGAAAGIVITASHNPPKYNGYKVYLSDGGQIVPPYDRQIIEAVNAVGDYGNIRRISRESAEERGLLVAIGKEIDDRYLATLKTFLLSPEAVGEYARQIKIVYTPLHGTGNVPVRRILGDMGFEVHVVPEQEQPDGEFPTVSAPNPENPAAFDLALALAKKTDADLILATDPDADRLGVYAKDARSGEYKRFTGNMSGILIAEYVLSRKKERGTLPQPAENGALVTTIVSTDMAKAVAKEYGVTLIETLTGFKYIGEQIRLFEEAKEKNGGNADAARGAYEYLFGFEESYGCLIGTYARDKDAVSAVAALCDAAAYYKQRGLTLWDQMLRIYEKYGYYAEDLADKSFPGADGAEKMASILDDLRKAPAKIGDLRVLALRDYRSRIRTNLLTGEREPLRLPESNVLYFELENGWCCIRPSGTEPKIKLYFGVKDISRELSLKRLEHIKEQFSAVLIG